MFEYFLEQPTLIWVPRNGLLQSSLTTETKLVACHVCHIQTPNGVDWYNLDR